jgi:hypothetical protein
LGCLADRLVILIIVMSLTGQVRTGEAQSSPNIRSSPQVMPARYDEHRYIVTPVTEAGDTLYLYTDTGSTLDMLFPAAIERLGLVTDSLIQGTDTLRFATLPPFRPAASIPFRSAHPVLQRAVLVVDSIYFAYGTDGILGQHWFDGRVWTFDYPGHRLLLRPAGDLPRHSPEHRVPLGFQHDSNGRPTVHFPRIRVLIDGETVDLLLDTGAMTQLTANGLAALADGRPARRAASFVVRSVFERWHRRHPQWQVIESADQLGNVMFPMIKVPAVEVGGFTVGPVWFTVRRDKDFEHFSRWMDRPIVGAFGGSGLHYLAVTVDYPGSVAVFVQP